MMNVNPSVAASITHEVHLGGLAEVPAQSVSLRKAREVLGLVVRELRHGLEASGNLGVADLGHLKVLERRADEQLPRLLSNLWLVYGERADFKTVLHDVLNTFISTGLERPAELRALDEVREATPEWYGSHRMVETSLYVDKFSGGLARFLNELPVLKPLNVNMLHFMPTIYQLPSGDHDGGYAISDFRSVNPELGTMDELKGIFSAMREQGISPVMDVTVNHTAHDHAWAVAAKAGDPEKRDFYFFMDRAEKDEYQSRLFDVFPDIRQGSFTWSDEVGKFVWTTFKSTQWDLNYKNPKVLTAMAKELMFLANAGAEVLRFDAAAFIWKEKGTICFNRPKVIPLIQIYNALTKIAAPGLVFKSESVQEPRFTKQYIGQDLCQLGYNVMVPSHLWDSLANQNVEFLSAALARHMQEPDGRTWVNYTRSHDELAFYFDLDLMREQGINPDAHIQGLGQFYLGKGRRSFSTAEKFQINPRAFSGTQGSLAGIEKALQSNNPEQIHLAIQRVKLLNIVVMSLPGIPLINLVGGDDRAQVNDYSYKTDPEKASDNRWMHRPDRHINFAEKSEAEVSVMGQVFNDLAHLTRVRTHDMPAFGNGPMQVFSTGASSVLGFIRQKPEQKVIVLANFSEHEQHITPQFLSPHGVRFAIDKASTSDALAVVIDLQVPLKLEPYQAVWLTQAA